MPPDRLRLQLTGAPGRLDGIEDALGRLGVRVVDVDDEGDGGWLLELAVPLDLPAIEHALRAVGCRVDDLTLVCAARSW